MKTYTTDFADSACRSGITIGGEKLTLNGWSARVTDPAPSALFPDRDPRQGRYYEHDDNKGEVELTFRFTGPELLKAREILAALMSGKDILADPK